MTDTTQRPPRRSGTVGPPPRSQNGATPSSTYEEAPPRKQAVLDIIGIAMIPLAGLTAIQQAREPESVSPFAMDCFAIEAHASSLADSVVKLANGYPVLGAVLDKASSVTPLGALAGTVMALGMQIAENHGKLNMPAMAKQKLGVIDRQEMAQTVLKQAAVNGENSAT